MKQVQALKGFIHGEQRERGQRFFVTDMTADALARKGLVRILTDEGPTSKNPSTAAGEKSSASPAAPASPQTTAKRSGRGGRRKKGAG